MLIVTSGMYAGTPFIKISYHDKCESFGRVDNPAGRELFKQNNIKRIRILQLFDIAFKNHLVHYLKHLCVVHFIHLQYETVLP